MAYRMLVRYTIFINLTWARLKLLQLKFKKGFYYLQALGSNVHTPEACSFEFAEATVGLLCSCVLLAKPIMLCILSNFKSPWKSVSLSFWYLSGAVLYLGFWNVVKIITFFDIDLVCRSVTSVDVPIFHFLVWSQTTLSRHLTNQWLTLSGVAPVAVFSFIKIRHDTFILTFSCTLRLL